MKLNWKKFTKKKLYSWEVTIDSYILPFYVRHTERETRARGINTEQLLDRIYQMSFIDFGKARELVRIYNQNPKDCYTYDISYERKI